VDADEQPRGRDLLSGRFLRFGFVADDVTSIIGDEQTLAGIQ
jgi:hypothetical protein